MNHGNLQGFSSVPRNTEQKVYGAGIVTDPRMMPMCKANGNGPYFKNGSSSVVSWSGGQPADHLTQLMNGVTAKTNLLTINNSGGVLTHFVSATSPGGVLTLSITVDGELYTITSEALSSSIRFMLGSAITIGTLETTSAASPGTLYFKGLGTVNDPGHLAKSGKHVNCTQSDILPSIFQTISLGLPRLRFEKSLSIDTQYSIGPDNSGGGTGNSLSTQTCGYLLD